MHGQVYRYHWRRRKKVEIFNWKKSHLPQVIQVKFHYHHHNHHRYQKVLQIIREEEEKQINNKTTTKQLFEWIELCFFVLLLVVMKAKNFIQIQIFFQWMNESSSSLSTGTTTTTTTTLRAWNTKILQRRRKKIELHHKFLAHSNCGSSFFLLGKNRRISIEIKS